MQNTLTTIDTNKYLPYTIGFDGLFDRLFGIEDNTNSFGYPPYNIVKIDDYNYVIEMAIAGFNKNDIKIELSDGELTIKSKKEQEDLANKNQETIIHQGISSRQFIRKFTLSDEVHVKEANLSDGMLKIKLEKVIPEHKKTKTIKIS